MMWTDFVEKLENAITASDSKTVFHLAPFVPMPLAFYRHDDPFFPYSQAVIRETQQPVCAYLFDMGAYLAQGAAGAVALERSIGAVPHEKPVLLTGVFSGEGWSAMADNIAFGVDALLVADSLEHYLENPPYAAFLRRDDDSAVPERGGLYSAKNQTLRFHGSNKRDMTLHIVSDKSLDVPRDASYLDVLCEKLESLR